MTRMLQDQLRHLLDNEIHNERLPGAVVHVMHKGDIVLREAYGHRVVHPETAPMQVDTVFDLASLTKVVATLPAVLKLMEEGRLSLSDPLESLLSETKRPEGESIRIVHLLTHTSGLRADIANARTIERMTREQILETVLREEPVHAPGTKVVYSDIGLILLSLVVERVTGESFDRYVKRELFEPLGMKNTGFNLGIAKERYAVTEFNERLGGYKCGVVHDEKADVLGGVSGHAGLFSTADDLAVFASMFREGGTYKGKRVLSREAVELSRRNFTAWDPEFRGLGWMLHHPTRSSSGGDFLSPSAYGHTGFTGTSLWIDPAVDLQVILLTNRVHFGRTDHILRLRPRVHNLIRSSLAP